MFSHQLQLRSIVLRGLPLSSHNQRTGRLNQLSPRLLPVGEMCQIQFQEAQSGKSYQLLVNQIHEVIDLFPQVNCEMLRVSCIVVRFLCMLDMTFSPLVSSRPQLTSVHVDQETLLHDSVMVVEKNLAYLSNI
jgi:hypothetical protein